MRLDGGTLIIVVYLTVFEAESCQLAEDCRLMGQALVTALSCFDGPNNVRKDKAIANHLQDGKGTFDYQTSLQYTILNSQSILDGGMEGAE